jgi:hypothetical protein
MTYKKQIHSKFLKKALFDSLNRSVYASPPGGGPDCGFALVSAAPHSHAKPPPRFASHSLCPAKPLFEPPKRYAKYQSNSFVQ